MVLVSVSCPELFFISFVFSHSLFFSYCDNFKVS
jgi:hypothetical protein